MIMPRTEKQYARIREEKRALIKNIALELFASEGYYYTSISKIAKKAAISKGLVYNYFKSKEDLLKEIISDGFDTFTVVFDPNKDGILTDDEFDYFINEVFNILRSNTKYWRLFFGIILQSIVYDFVEEQLIRILSPMSKTLNNFMERKNADDPATDARFFMAVLDGVAFHYILDPDNFPLEKIKNRIINFFTRC